MISREGRMEVRLKTSNNGQARMEFLLRARTDLEHGARAHLRVFVREVLDVILSSVFLLLRVLRELRSHL